MPVRNRNFLSKSIFPKIKNYRKFKLKIDNNYLTSDTNDENMSFVYEFSKLMNIVKNLL